MKRVPSFTREEGVRGGFRGGEVYVEEGHLDKTGGRSIRFYLVYGKKIALHYITPTRLLAVGTIGAYLMTNKKQTNAILDTMKELVPAEQKNADIYRIGFLLITGSSLLMNSLDYCRRIVLRVVMSNQRWMFHPNSIVSKAIALSVKALSGICPPTYYFEQTLPKLPVPSLKHTTELWLDSMDPLLSDDEKTRMKVLIKDFCEKSGPFLQRILWLKSLWANNWIEDWWEKYVYLRGENSIMINTNFYGLDLEHVPTTNQASRAASIIFHFLRFKRLCDKAELPPMRLLNVFPLSMVGFQRLFSTTRVPGIEEDELVHFDRKQSRHIVVICKGAFYKLPVHHINGCPLSMGDLERQIQFILKDASSNPAPSTEATIPVLTAMPRREWAEVRQSYFASGPNEKVLSLIESAAFVLTLVDDAPQTIDERGRLALHGTGTQYWFDKSFTVIISKDGRASFNCEHSFADAPIMACAWEYVLYSEIGAEEETNCYETKYKFFDQEGRMLNRETSCWKYQLQSPTRLRFDVSNPELCATLSKAVTDAQKLISETDLHIEVFPEYGKGFVKKCRMSPDGYIQAALHLAYYRTYHELALTYESGSARLFRGGRTETIRSLSKYSAAFVRKMCDPSTPREDVIAALQESTKYHVYYTKCAMTGGGVDRHLFGLYVVSVGFGAQTPRFLKEAMGTKWGMSTSQTPTRQTKLWAPFIADKYPELRSQGGGFGPVGTYGVSYIIQGEDTLVFHIATKTTNEGTSALRFGAAIRQALLDMQSLFVDSQ